MVQKHEFENSTDYLQTQIGTTRRKLPKARLSTTPECIDEICRYVAQDGRQVRRGICHGVRSGEEVWLFKTQLGGVWAGTEITPELCDGETIICHDFRQHRREWVGAFDVVYSNSLDHSDRPESTLKTWLKSLAPGGLLCLEHHRYMERVSRHGKADCFGATVIEYMAMVRDAGGELRAELVVRDEPERRPRPLTRTILVFSYCGC